MESGTTMLRMISTGGVKSQIASDRSEGVWDS